VTEDALTSPGVAVGTVAYMSPEQAKGVALDARTDLFSLGAVLYEMATGRHAFPGDTSAVVFEAILNRTPVSPLRLNPQSPPELERIILKALEKDPKLRYQTASDLRSDLQRLKRDTDSRRIAAAAPPPTARKGLSGKAIQSLAVLPFVNVSGDPEIDYLSDGISESIINRLATLPGLRVVPRRMAFRYKDPNVEPQQAGRELGVRAVLAGRVLQRGESLVVKAELVDVVNEAQLWGEHYSRKLADILAVEDDIAREISSNLQLRLTSVQKRRLTKHHTQSTAAYQLYLKGRHLWNQRGRGMAAAISYFEQALAVDPRYALAHSGLADCYITLGFYGYLAPSQALPKAAAAAFRALEIDDNLGEAHCSVGLVYLLRDWDPVVAEREFKRAIQLSPNHLLAHYSYSLLLLRAGREEECVARDRMAVQIDPLSAVVNAHLGWMLVTLRRFEEAIPTLRTALDLDPNNSLAHGMLGYAYAQQAKHEEAVAESRAAALLSERNSSWMLGIFAYACARAGRRAEALELLAEMVQKAASQYVRGSSLALLCHALGEEEQALEWLEKAYEERDVWFPFLPRDPAFAPLLAHPRASALLRRAGIR
jgi:TolB-like protein/tetratricopeptide (TPR) repeat protein